MGLNIFNAGRLAGRRPNLNTRFAEFAFDKRIVLPFLMAFYCWTKVFVNLVLRDFLSEKLFCIVFDVLKDRLINSKNAMLYFLRGAQIKTDSVRGLISEH